MLKIIHIGMNPDFEEQEKGDDLVRVFQVASNEKRNDYGQSGLFTQEKVLFIEQFSCLNNKYVGISYCVFSV